MMRAIFPSLIGNAAVKEHIGRDIAKGINSHAYIIEGAIGSGKKMIAKLIASAVSCQNLGSTDLPLPCGECDNCRRIAKDISGDVVWITKEDKATIGVDAVRRIREGLYVTPNDSAVRTYIITEAEKMTPQAQNALLLTLEEPPSFVMFILLTEDASKLLETVRSRAQTVRTETFSSDNVAKFLLSIDKGRLLQKRDAEKFASTVALSAGILGKALSFCEDSAESEELLRNREIAGELVPLLCKGKASLMLRSISAVNIKNGTEAKSILLLLDNAIRDLLAVKKTESPSLLYYTSHSEAMRYATEATVKKLVKIHEEICFAIAKLDSNVSPKTVLTDMILKISHYKR